MDWPRRKRDPRTTLHVPEGVRNQLGDLADEIAKNAGLPCSLAKAVEIAIRFTHIAAIDGVRVEHGYPMGRSTQ